MNRSELLRLGRKRDTLLDTILVCGCWITFWTVIVVVFLTGLLALLTLAPILFVVCIAVLIAALINKLWKTE